jgi:hypothetical protein
MRKFHPKYFKKWFSFSNLIFLEDFIDILLNFGSESTVITNLTADIQMSILEINHSILFQRKRDIIPNLKNIMLRNPFNKHIQNLLNDTPFEICEDPEAYLVALCLRDNDNITSQCIDFLIKIVLKMKKCLSFCYQKSSQNVVLIIPINSYSNQKEHVVSFFEKYQLRIFDSLIQ